MAINNSEGLPTITPMVEPEKSVGSVSLEQPPRLLSSRVLGPSAVFTALAIGSGELIFWPGLSLSYGAGVLWIALAAVGVQYLIDIEIGRYSLATGESVVVGSTRLWKGWGIVLLFGAIIPWLWPGWARAGAQLLNVTYGLPEKAMTIGSLLLCGALLIFPSSIYRLLEKLQTFFLIFILVGVFLLFLLTVSVQPDLGLFWKNFLTFKGARELLEKAAFTRDADYLALLGGIVFAGAGGILNLGYGLLICEKKFAMGKFSRPVVGLMHSFGLEKTEDIPNLADTLESRRTWKAWLRMLRAEHAMLFLLGNSFTIIFLSLIFFGLLGEATAVQGTGFLGLASESFGNLIGSAASTLFIAVAFLILFTSEIGILDITSRLASGILHTTFPRLPMTSSLTYHVVVWLEITIGITIVLLDPRQPFYYLVTSAMLNILVMSVYAGLVAYMNRSILPNMTRPSIVTTVFVWLCALTFFLLFIVSLFKVA